MDLFCAKHLLLINKLIIFYIFKALIMKDSMLANIHLRNGIKDKYTTNDNECMNSKFKNHVNYKASDLPNFIRDVQQFVQIDQKVIESAFAGNGEYHFVEEFMPFNVGSKWWGFSPAKRNGHVNKFLEACKNRSSLEMFASCPPQPPVESMQPECSSASLDENRPTLPTVNISRNVLKGILEKAEKLVKDNLVSGIKRKENKQIAIASQSDIYPRVVIREDRKRKGEDIVELKCSPGTGCLNFSTHGMCLHTQAAALAWDVKNEYWQFLETSKKVGTSLQNLSKHGLPGGSGKKDHVINRTGRNRMFTSTTPKENAPSHSISNSANNRQRQKQQQQQPQQQQQQSQQQQQQQHQQHQHQHQRFIPSTSDTNPGLRSMPQFQPVSYIPGHTEIAHHIRTRVGLQDVGSPSFVPRFPAMVATNPIPQTGQFWLYMLQFCPKQVNICFGCSESLKINGHICKPPHDLVIVSNEQMERQGNVYFHLNENCVRKKQQLFHMSYLFVPHDIIPYLEPAHVHLLSNHGIKF